MDFLKFIGRVLYAYGIVFVILSKTNNKKWFILNIAFFGCICLGAYLLSLK